jgi:hypothetical protein
LPQFGSTQKNRKVKQGGEIAATADVLYALKGNKTRELWRYVPATATTEFGAYAWYGAGGRGGGSGSFSGESGLSDGIEATSPPR